jgi:hypothetical protein
MVIAKITSYFNGPLLYGTGIGRGGERRRYAFNINPSMPLGLAVGYRYASRSPRINPPAGRPAAAAVRPFYSSFDWLEGLASWPATNLLLYLA